MALIQLVYASVAKHDMSDDDLRDILRTSRANNEINGITGMLLYRDRYFIQVLEGEDTDVRNIYAKIETDSRHKDLVVMYQGMVEAREFDRWTMGFNHLERVSGEDMPGFTDFLDNPIQPDYFNQANFGQVMMLMRAFRDRTSF